MSRGETASLLGIAVVLPLAFAPLIAVAGGTERTRKILAAVYSVLAVAFNVALLDAFLTAKHPVHLGSVVLTRLNFAPFLLLNLATAAAVLYAGYRNADETRPALLFATLPLAGGLASLAFLANGLLAFALLWEAVTAVALAGLLLHGSNGMLKRLRSFLPWLFSDALFILGAILCASWLKESGVLIRPPLTSGSEAQAVTVMLLFLVSALIRLGVFPFHFWVKDLFGRTSTSWSAFMMGAVNFLLVGFRLLIVAALIARVVAGDWSTVIVVAGLASVVAGPLIALFSKKTSGYVSGMYTLQAGFLLVGVGLFSRPGLEGSAFSLLVAPLSLMAAMMALGTLDQMRGSRNLYGRGISAGIAPAAFVVVLLSGMSLAGLPPLDGFVGKALLIVANLDKAGGRADYTITAAVMMAGIALGAVAFIRLIGGVFWRGTETVAISKPTRGSSIAPLALCSASLLLGAFPRLLLRNFARPGSLLLFANGFSGPGVVFKGAGTASTYSFTEYVAWTQPVAAFILAASLLLLVLYFASRHAWPEAPERREQRPFLGGAAGDYAPTGDVELPARLARFRSREVER